MNIPGRINSVAILLGWRKTVELDFSIQGSFSSKYSDVEELPAFTKTKNDETETLGQFS